MKFTLTAILIGLSFLQGGRMAADSGPSTLMVTNGDDDGVGSLREVIRDAAPDATIQFIYTGVILLTSDELLIDKNLTIAGPGSSLVSVSRDANAAQEFRLLEISSGVTVSVSGVTFSNGVGGIFNGGVLSLSDVQIINDGLGCVNSAGAQMSLTNCSVTGNESICGFLLFFECGGGIVNDGDLTVQGSTISGNTAANGGGVLSTGTATITNCTIAGNAAVTTGPHGLQGGYGGGLDLNGSAVLVSDTISGNQCVWQGGGVLAADTLTITNCIVSGNISQTHPDNADVSAIVQSGGSNLVGVSFDGAGFGANDLTGTADAPLEADLGPLQDNGGFTFTMALLPGSPAIDQGISQGLATDQRGMPRTADQLNLSNAVGGDGTDIGSFELPVVVPTFGNISTRINVGTGDKVLIAGFIVAGTQPKKVIVRAIGPSLNAFGVSGTLADPLVELLDSNGASITTNDNWQESPDKQAIIDTGIPPTNDNESAILMTLNPGAYTAVVSGANNGTGVGLVEVYDLDQSADSKLANISTRGLVQTDDNVMIGGLIVLGTEPTNSVVRAIGPSLPLPGTLSDPTLELHDGNGVLIASNDNWKDTQQAEIEAAALAPTSDLEAAIAVTLFPGGYTAIVGGKDNATGIALVEAYQLDR